MLVGKGSEFQAAAPFTGSAPAEKPQGEKVLEQPAQFFIPDVFGCETTQVGEAHAPGRALFEQAEKLLHQHRRFERVPGLFGEAAPCRREEGFETQPLPRREKKQRTCVLLLRLPPRPTRCKSEAVLGGGPNSITSSIESMLMPSSRVEVHMQSATRASTKPAFTAAGMALEQRRKNRFGLSRCRCRDYKRIEILQHHRNRPPLHLGKVAVGGKKADHSLERLSLTVSIGESLPRLSSQRYFWEWGRCARSA